MDRETGDACMIPRSMFTVLLIAVTIVGTPQIFSEEIQLSSLEKSVTEETADSQVFTLQQAIDFALKHNTSVKKAIEYKQWGVGKYIEERSAALPRLSLDAYTVRNYDGLQSKLADIPSTTDTQVTSLGLSQALYTWGQVGAAIHAAKAGIAYADELIDQSRQDVTTAIVEAFYDILLAKELYMLAQQNLDQKNRHLEEAERKLAAGTATDYDLLAARVAAENAKPQMIQSKNAIRIAHDRLRFLMNCESSDIQVSGELSYHQLELPSYDTALTRAFEQRPELAAMKYRISVAEDLVKIYSAGNKPRFDLRGSYNWSNLKTDSYDKDGSSWNAGIYLSFPFFDGLATSGRIRQARSDLQSLKNDKENLIQSISLEIRESLNRVKESDEIVQALAGTIEQAEKLLGLSEKGFELGVKTRLEVEDSELNLQTAKSNFMKAQRDFLIAEVLYLRATGEELAPKIAAEAD